MYYSTANWDGGFGLPAMQLVEEMFFYYVSRILFRLDKSLFILGQTGSILYK